MIDSLSVGCVPVLFHPAQATLWPLHWPNANRSSLLFDWTNGAPRPKTRAHAAYAERAKAVVDALLKGSAHKVPKLALACVEAMRVSVKEFGTPVVVPPKPMLKGIAPLFDSKDAKVRGAAKDLTVELTRWLGHDAVRRDLIEKMRGTMQAEVQAAADAIEIGRAVRQRLTRKEAANPPAPDTAVDHVDAMDVDGGDGAVASAATTNGDVKLPDAYEFADPESILDVLEKQPKDKETPKFWDAVNSSKWNQRLDLSLIHI